jgi:hypothetical protein
MKIDKENLNKCYQHANVLYKRKEKWYAKRGQKCPEKIHTDILQGKMAEVAVANYFNSFNPENKLAPDFSVYEDPTFNYDLESANGLKIHVKSCCKDDPYGGEYSWTFQYSSLSGNNNGHRDRMIFNERHISLKELVVFAVSSIRNKEADVISIAQLVLIKKYDIFRLPIKKELQQSKRVIYLRDLIRLKEKHNNLVRLNESLLNEKPY